MRNKRILITLTYYLPNISGLTNYVEFLAKNLASRGLEIKILCSRHLKTQKNYQEKDHIQIFRENIQLRIGRGALMFFYPWKAWKLVGESDIVNPHLPQLESIIVAIFAKLRRKQLIVTYHSEIPFNQNILNNILAILLQINHFFVLLLADQIVTNSEDYAKHSAILHFFSRKLNFIFPPAYNPYLKWQFRNEIQKSLRIGFVGRIIKDKGIDTILAAIPLLKEKFTDFKFILAGPQQEVIGGHYDQDLQAKLEKNSHYLEITGKLSDSALAEFYQSLDLFVFPSINRLESFGMAQIEAMLSGVPVVASDLPGVRVPVQVTQMGVLFKPGSAADLVDKILYVVNNYQNIIENYPKVKKNFSNSKFIDEYINEIF
ncbi:MAG: glycosyltransferase family 4 protein [bacterium]